MGESWEMALKDAASEFQRGILDNQNMDKKKPKYSNLCIFILERGEKYNLYKSIRKRNNFSLITKFPDKNERSTPLKNSSSAQRTATHQDKKEVSG